MRSGEVRLVKWGIAEGLLQIILLLAVQFQTHFANAPPSPKLELGIRSYLLKMLKTASSVSHKWDSLKHIVALAKLVVRFLLIGGFAITVC